MGSGKAVGPAVSVVTLVLALVLTTAGIASPLWRMVDTPGYSRYEGLWQVCVSRGEEEEEDEEEEDGCRFSGGKSGLWRAIQVVKLTSLLLLLCALVGTLAGTLAASVCTLAGCRQCRCAPRPCPAPSVAALVAGLTGLVGDLLYVGYIEFHADVFPGEHVYAWSFALSLAGSLLCLFSALVLCLAVRLSHPSQPDPPFKSDPSMSRPLPAKPHKKKLAKRGPHPYPSTHLQHGPYRSSVTHSYPYIDRYHASVDRWPTGSNRGFCKMRPYHPSRVRRQGEIPPKMFAPRKDYPDSRGRFRSSHEAPRGFSATAVGDVNRRHNDGERRAERPYRHTVIPVPDHSNATNNTPGVAQPQELSASSWPPRSEPREREATRLYGDCYRDRRGFPATRSSRFRSQQLYPHHSRNPWPLEHEADRRHVSFQEDGTPFTIYTAAEGHGHSRPEDCREPVTSYEIITEAQCSEQWDDLHLADTLPREWYQWRRPSAPLPQFEGRAVDSGRAGVPYFKRRAWLPWVRYPGQGRRVTN